MKQTNTDIKSAYKKENGTNLGNISRRGYFTHFTHVYWNRSEEISKNPQKEVTNPSKIHVAMHPTIWTINIIDIGILVAKLIEET